VKRLFLLDGMALVYRGHFALSARPIFTSRGVNTSALFVFTQTLLEILKNQQPTHIAVAFDTETPTHRHAEFPQYKATREAMPEDLAQALPQVRRLLEAFHIPVLTCDGFEADDLIGTLVRRAEKEGFESYMVTPDKDFGQLVDEHTFLYKPGRMGSDVEVLGVPEIRQRWGIQRTEQVIDILALMGDSIDNIPGVPGIGEKTASKLIGQFDTVENLLAHTSELKGRVKDNLEKHRADALLSKRLATLICDAPCRVELDSLRLQPRDDDTLKALLVEFEFNTIGRRLYGDDFKAGRGFVEAQAGSAAEPAASGAALHEAPARLKSSARAPAQTELIATTAEFVLEGQTEAQKPAATSNLKGLRDVPHQYHIVCSAAERAALIRRLESQTSFAFDLQTSHLDPKQAGILGLTFSCAPHEAFYVPVPEPEAGDASGSSVKSILAEFRPLLESTSHEKVGWNLKYDVTVLKWHGISLRGKLFDLMVAHSLIEPDMRHSLAYLSEAYLGYAPLDLQRLLESEHLQSPAEVAVERLGEYAGEAADLELQLRERLTPLLVEKRQERVFYELESPLIPVLAAMELEGIKVDAAALAEFGAQLSKEIDQQEKAICQLAGTTFNLNSPRQLGQILFEVMKLCESPKKTRTGQYATDEQTLMALAPDHEIVRRLLEHRAATKLKSTYADALPTAIWPPTGRIHTTYNQVMTATGRLNSQNPNLQNIPIRTERGQEIRKAFVPRNSEFRLLSADYSQIELRIIAALSQEAGLLEAFRTGADVHTTTAAKVFGVFPELVTPEMRRKAKMVNYGIAYGISAFGLAQRLGIARKEAAQIIEHYFAQFSGIRQFMDQTIAFARKEGYVQTVTERRRYIRDIASSNNTLRSAAERNAINAPIQGTAADLIKLAMIRIDQELEQRRLRTRLLLQVHDELVFDLYAPEEKDVRALVEQHMKTAIALEVPLVVEMGVGKNWLEAH
jgi:DNA polymerase-1